LNFSNKFKLAEHGCHHIAKPSTLAVIFSSPIQLEDLFNSRILISKTYKVKLVSQASAIALIILVLMYPTGQVHLASVR
jgi:hypothetical protein